MAIDSASPTGALVSPNILSEKTSQSRDDRATTDNMTAISDKITTSAISKSVRLPTIRSDLAFAFFIIAILVVLIFPMPAFLLDYMLAGSIIFSVLILMTVLFIEKPLEFSAFPAVLLIATMLRLALNLASTRLILAYGHDGTTAAGLVIEGFGNLVMQGSFVIGMIIFVTLFLSNLVPDVVWNIIVYTFAVIGASVLLLLSSGLFVLKYRDTNKRQLNSIKQNNKQQIDNAQLANLFDNAPFAIATVDGNGKIGRINFNFSNLFTNKADNLFNSLSSSGANKLSNAINKGLTNPNQAITPIDVTLNTDNSDNADTKAGVRAKSIRFFIVPIKDSACSQPEGMVSIYALDITEQKALEQQFAQSQKMQAIGQLAGGIAHDFNNVLTAIIGNSDLLLQKHRPSDSAFFDIMNIKQNAMRAAGLVRQLLAFSRKQTLKSQVLNVDEVISDLRNMLARLLGDAVTLQLTREGELWPVFTDVTQFEQVIINLAVNARDAMPDGGILTIKTTNVHQTQVGNFNFSELPTADYVLIEVEDNGTGMSDEVMDKIFDPFFTTKGVGEGTGLGLSTVYGIVRQSGGFIFVTSKPDKGTTFYIFIPRHNSTATVSNKSGKGRNAGKYDDINDFTGSGRILLVEDEDAVRLFAARALKSRGYSVYEAANASKAIEIQNNSKEPIDLVVSDIMMPGMDGPTMIDTMRRTNPELKVVFVSGYAEDSFKSHIADHDDCYFLPKPFTLKDLAGIVKRALA